MAAVIREQSLAIATGDGEAACGHFSPAARRDLDELLLRRSPDFPVDCALALSEVAGRLPEGALEALREPVLVSVQVDGDRAEAQLRLPRELTRLAQEVARQGESEPGATPLRKIGGEWKVDALAF